MKSVEIRSFTPNAGKYGPEITPYLDTFHTLSTKGISLKLPPVTSSVVQVIRVTLDVITENVQVQNTAYVGTPSF